MTAQVWAVVPVKPFAIAKQRLAPILAPGERAHLARVMLEDVLTALAASRHVLAGTVVLTADPEAADVAQRFGAQVVAETAGAGLNAALAEAIGHLAGRGDAGMLVVPSDLPHLRVSAIEAVMPCLAAARSVAIARASRDGGTNLLACRPAGVIAPRFGPRSFDAHCLAARAAGIAPDVLTGSGLGHDLDRPDDLAMFLSSPPSTRTHAYLTSLEIEERLSCSMRS